MNSHLFIGGVVELHLLALHLLTVREQTKKWKTSLLLRCPKIYVIIDFSDPVQGKLEQQVFRTI